MLNHNSTNNNNRKRTFTSSAIISKPISLWINVNLCSISTIIIVLLLFMINGLLFNIKHGGIGIVTGFNFDVESPIIIHNGFDGSTSHFGASVALISSSTTTSHNDQDNNDNVTGWVIIGSPKADSPHVNYSGIKEPGLLWRCSLGSEIDCQPLLLDSFGEANVKRDAVHHLNLVHHDRKEGSMLGATLETDGNKNLISCASRWMNQKYLGYHLMNGLCYWIDTAQLTTIKQLQVSSNNNNDNTSIDWCEPQATRLLPLVDKSRLAYTIPNTDPPEKRFDWAFGQTGFSTHWTQTGELLLGAPGVLEWTGSIIRYRNVSKPVSSRNKVHAIKVKSKQGQSTSSSGRQLPFNDVVVLKAQTIKKVLQYFDYFGYAVTSGRFFKTTSTRSHSEETSSSSYSSSSTMSEIQYASGAPRGASLSGQVLIFSINELTESLQLLNDPIDGGYNGFGSYFGSVLSAGDVNGDGYDELLIGAPLYSSTISTTTTTTTSTTSKGQETTTSSTNNNNTSKGSDSNDDDDDSDSIGGASTGDEGCVFIYFSNGDHFIEKRQELCGSHLPGSRFGSAISFIGDVNVDGYVDVAIGAPYENDGQGVVYIYLGSHAGLILSQKLSPSNHHTNIKGFGLSISNGGIDIDENGLPDLAIGAYETNHVFVFRSIPVVNISGNLSVTIDKISTSTGRFELVSCLNYNGKNVPESMRIWLKITIDIEIRKSRIVEFMSEQPQESSTTTDNNNMIGTFKTYLVRLNSYQRDYGSCYTFIATSVGDLDLVTLPVTIRQEFWPESSNPSSIFNNPAESSNISNNNQEPNTKTSISSPIYIDIKKRSIKISTTNKISKIPITTRRSSSPQFNDFATTKLPLSMYNSDVNNVNLYSIPIAAICEDDGNPECLASLVLSGSLENSDDGIIYSLDEPFIIGSYPSLVLKLELLNLRETANLPLSLDIAWIGPPIFKNHGANNECRRRSGLNLIDLAHDENIVIGQRVKIEQHYTCVFKKPLTRNKKEFVEIELDTTELYSDGRDSYSWLTFYTSANTSSALETPTDTILKFPMIGKSELSFYGQGSEAPYYDNMTAETVNFTHIYEVGLQGPSPVYSVIMDFFLPSGILIDNIEHELLRIREPLTTYDGSRLRCSSINSNFYVETSTSSSEYDVDDMNDIYLLTSSTSSAQIRNKRQISYAEQQQAASTNNNNNNNIGRRQQLVLGCASSPQYLNSFSNNPSSNIKVSNNEIKDCLHVQCEATYFHPGATATIEFRLRLVTNTAKKIFMDEELELIQLHSIGRVQLRNSTGHSFGQTHISSPKVVIKIQRPAELEAWILIVAMGSGLILLTLLTVLLTRCGFFRRTKREELDALKAQAEVNEHFGFDFVHAYEDDIDDVDLDNIYHDDELISYHQGLELGLITPQPRPPPSLPFQPRRSSMNPILIDPRLVGHGHGHGLQNLEVHDPNTILPSSNEFDYDDYAEIYDYRYNNHHHHNVVGNDGRTYC